MNLKKALALFFIIIFLGLMMKADFVFAQQSSVGVYFFYSTICSHCDEEKEFLKDLEKKYPEIEIKKYEIVYNPENQKILNDFYDKYQVPKGEQGWIPVTFTANRYFIGFNQEISEDIESCLKECLGEGKATPQKIKIPFFGSIDISRMSLSTLTITLGALDGLNPCAMWVLLFLIVLLVNTRSRKRLWLIGGTFILASGVVYYLILTTWLNLFLAISYVNLTRILIGVFALGVGVWQIKNFIAYHPGVCKILGISSKIERGLKLKERAEKIIASPFTLAIIGGLIILALGVNLIEVFCSAGLPAIFTRILALNELSTLSYYLYLLLYTFVFMLDDLIVFLIAVITLSKIGFTEKYNYWATLIGGLLMLILGLLLIFKPEWLMFAP